MTYCKGDLIRYQHNTWSENDWALGIVIGFSNEDNEGKINVYWQDLKECDWFPADPLYAKLEFVRGANGNKKRNTG